MTDAKNETKFDYNKDTWKVLDAFFKQPYILTANQIDSMNNMMDTVIPMIIEKNNPVNIGTDYDTTTNDFKRKVVIRFGQLYVSKPLIHENNDTIRPLYPNEARLRGLTYSAPMFIDVSCKVYERNTQINEFTLNKVPFCKMPVMLGSNYCHLHGHSASSISEMGECQYDQFGYFIVNGGERVLVAQERPADNKVFVWAPNKATTSKYTVCAEIRASTDQRFYPVTTNRVYLTKEPSQRAIKQAIKENKIYGSTLHVLVSKKIFKEEIPLFVLFRALGIGTESEMEKMILSNGSQDNQKYHNMLIPSIMDARYREVKIGDKTTLIHTQKDALMYMADRLTIKLSDNFSKDPKNKIKYVMDALNRELLPNTGQMATDVGESFRKKAMYLGYMTYKLLECCNGARNYDDRDDYSNKRVDLAGPLITTIFRENFIKLLHDLRQKVLTLVSTDTAEYEKLSNEIRKVIQGCGIDAKIKYSLATGNWATKKQSMSTTKKGISQVLNRMTFAASLSHARRIQSPLERSGSKIVPPRKLHSTHFGMCCPNETPEGQQIGIVKNLAMLTHISIQTTDYPIRMILGRLGVTDLATAVTDQLKSSTKIFINGDWFGIIDEQETHKLYQRLKVLKRHGVIVPYISIAWFIDWKELRIQTDGGRYCRPIYIMDSSGSYLTIEKRVHDDPTFLDDLRQGKIQWNQLLCNEKVTAKDATVDNGAVIEYLDTDEIENAMCMMTYSDITRNNQDIAENSDSYIHPTHMEIHPVASMMGIISAQIPFSHMNQSPRNCYQSSMHKQSIGYFVTNYNSRMDTIAHVLVYGQKPLVATKLAQYLIMDKLPQGVNSMLLYACLRGYNQEDAIIMNKDSVERGYFNTIFYRSYGDKEQKHRTITTATERFTNPQKEVGCNTKIHGSYHAINDQGEPKLGEYVNGEDIIIGKVIELRDNQTKDVSDKKPMTCKDASTSTRRNEYGIIDKVYPPNGKSAYNGEGHRIIKVRVASLRLPELGDKFASRYSQKGTIGMLFRSVDMPMTDTGLVPDIIMNPHGMPSRMTIGKLMETLVGRIASYTGEFQDATPFNKLDFDQLKETLKKYGVNEYGNEVMYNGMTGQMFESVFFYGPTYYQRLKHMVLDKVHSRESGPVQLLTRQPAEGRSREGGLRLGEMERDVMIAHGVSQFLKERFMDCSDSFKTYISKKQETFIVCNPYEHIYQYGTQQIKDDEIVQIQLPYAMKLLLQELQSSGMDIRLVV